MVPEQIVKAAATWGALQSVTGALDGARIAPELQELDLRSWGRGNTVQNEGEVVFEVTEEQILEGGEEVIAAEVTGAEVEGREGESEEERTRIHLRRFSKLCLGSYGG